MIDNVEHKRVTPPFVDRHLRCIDCNSEFLFSAEEKNYFYDKNFYYPKRCPSCREARKRNHPPTTSEVLEPGSSLNPHNNHQGAQQ